MASHVILKNSLSPVRLHMRSDLFCSRLVLESWPSITLIRLFGSLHIHLLDPWTQTPFWIIFKIHALTGTLTLTTITVDNWTDTCRLLFRLLKIETNYYFFNPVSSPPPQIKTLIQSVAGPLLRTQVVKPTSSQGRTVRLKLVRRREEIRGEGDGNSDSSRNSSSWHEVRAVRLEQRAALMVKMTKQLIQTGVTAVPTLNQCSENFNSMFQDVFVSRQRLT